MIFTYAVIFVFVVLMVLMVLYTIQTIMGPKKIGEIAAMIESGQTRLAIKKLNDILEKDERNSYAHFLLAEANLKEKNTKYAIVEYRQVLKIGKFDPKYSEISIRSRLAKIYKNRKALEEAKREYLILSKLDPDNYENYYELGLIFYNSGLMDKALPFFKKSLNLNRKFDMPHYYLGQIYYRNNLFNEAKHSLIQAIKIEPSNYRAHYFLGLVLRQMNDYEWAIKEFDIAQRDENVKVKCFLAKGSCYLERELHPKAIQEFERGLKFARHGSDTELGLRYYLAESYEKMRDLQQAIRQWEKIAEVQQNFRDVQEKLRSYSEFRQDDRIKDFLIAGLSQFEHLSRKLVEALSFKIIDIDIISDTEIEIIGTETEGKWRNARQTNRIIRIMRTTDTIQERFIRDIYENMRTKNATRIIIITSGEFTQSAIEFANTRPVVLYGKTELIEMLKKL